MAIVLVAPTDGLVTALSKGNGAVIAEVIVLAKLLVFVVMTVIAVNRWYITGTGDGAGVDAWGFKDQVDKGIII